MSETKGSTTKSLFVFIVIVAVVAGIYVLNMNRFNGFLGIGEKAAPTAMTPAASNPNLVPGGSTPVPDAAQPAQNPAGTATPPAAPSDDKKADDKKTPG